MVRGWTRNAEFERFMGVLVEVGDPFGVPTSLASRYGDQVIMLSDSAAGVYESITGASSWTSASARAAYEVEFEQCLSTLGDQQAPARLRAREFPALYDPLAAPGVSSKQIVECVAFALIRTEREVGTGSVGYTAAYRNYVDNRVARDGEPDFILHERPYSEATGRSPYINNEAMTRFRAFARTCPE